MSYALARACANVALAKYWGKRDDKLNLPYTGSLSVTLAGLTTTARVAPASQQAGDSVLVHRDAAPPQKTQRTRTFAQPVPTRAPSHRLSPPGCSITPRHVRTVSRLR